MDGLDRWTNERVLKCAANVKCSVKELCFLCGLVNAKSVESLQRKNKWPMYLTLQFNKLERFAIGARSPDFQDIAVVKFLSRPKPEKHES